MSSSAFNRFEASQPMLGSSPPTRTIARSQHFIPDYPPPSYDQVLREIQDEKRRNAKKRFPKNIDWSTGW